ncbi:MAG: hypothetical protein KDA75_01420 [Planctomycetaceae bacterium]|nr:hypothetical protein [Planctomycetaceae bacterium]
MILVSLLVVYLLVRPTLSDWFGVRLPGLFPEESVAVNSEPAGNRSASEPTDQGRRSTGGDSADRTISLPQPAPPVVASAPSAAEREAEVQRKDAGDNEPMPSTRSVPIAKEKPTTASTSRPPNTSTPPATAATSEKASTPAQSTPNRNGPPAVATRTSPTVPPKDSKSGAGEKPTVSKPTTPAKPKPKLGALTDLGNKRYQSTAGLIYRQLRSEHRLEHVMRHAEDDPSRSVHGVFDGDQDRILAVIDEAYLIALTSGPPKAISEDQDDRTVMTVDLGRKIGYMGGQAGKRRNFPACRHLQLVVEGEEVVTAYPVIPR